MSPEPFIEIDWLLRRIDDPNLRIVDARNIPHGVPSTMPSGPLQYAAGHIPGAIYLDYAHELADPTTPFATRVADADSFAREVSQRGIGDAATIVAYDAGTIPFAARIVWNFLYYGHFAAHILAGGLPAWLTAGHSVTQEIPKYQPMTFTPHEDARLRASREEVIAATKNGSPVQLLETQRDTTYAARERDIPGVIRLSGSELLEDQRDGRVADPQTLERLISERQLDRNKRTIVSCGSGVSAAGSYFALKAAGFSDVGVYDGSWLEWSHYRLPTVAKVVGAT